MTPPEQGADSIRLTGTSYVILGTLDWLGPSTPYDMKRALAQSVEDFFPIPHASFYAEPERLARAGYLRARQERGGRRRKRYELTKRGRTALADWLADEQTGYGQFRFPGMLKLFFGADPGRFAADQAEHHRSLAERFEAVRDRADAGELDIPPRRRVVLDTGIRIHRWWERTWRELPELP